MLRARAVRLVAVVAREMSAAAWAGVVVPTWD